MSPLLLTIGITFVLLCGAIVAVTIMSRRRGMHLWYPAYLQQRRSRRAIRHPAEHPVDVFLAICDHFEPEWGRPEKSRAVARVHRWRTEYPQQFANFFDVDGRNPQHTFFFPQDEYQPEYLELLAELCGQGFGDVDIHLHHDRDTREGLTEKLTTFRDVLFHEHGLLRRDPLTGRITWGFIHGNWALCNSRPDGRWCGVNEEIDVLLETGCYADFTMPSAPSLTQTRTVNSIYYARQHPGSPKSHDTGTPASVGRAAPADRLLMIQGPLVPDWNRRKWGMLPRIENGDLTARRPPSLERLRLWLNAGVQVEGRPDWRFIKLHTHGCKDGNIDMLLGEAMRQFHAELAVHADANPNFRFHYVTAWEMAQLVHAAEEYSTDYRDVLAVPRTLPSRQLVT